MVSNDGLISLQVRRLSVLVDGPHSELVLLALTERFDCVLPGGGGSCRQPLPSQRVQLLYLHKVRSCVLRRLAQSGLVLGLQSFIDIDIDIDIDVELELELELD